MVRAGRVLALKGSRETQLKEQIPRPCPADGWACVRTTQWASVPLKAKDTQRPRPLSLPPLSSPLLYSTLLFPFSSPILLKLPLHPSPKNNPTPQKLKALSHASAESIELSVPQRMEKLKEFIASSPTWGWKNGIEGLRTTLARKSGKLASMISDQVLLDG
jgi:hypothetical protein